MSDYALPIAKLIDEFAKLPGIGKKSALRLAFHVLKMDKDKIDRLIDSLEAVKKDIHTCACCGNFTENELCYICSNPKRNNRLICVVEDAKDIMSIEKTHEFNGLYHVLHGALSPMEGISPDDINIKELIKRLGDIDEVILATNTSIEGEATSMYIARIIKPMGIKVTRLAHGVPMGGDIEYADEITLGKAFIGRHEI